MTKVSMHKLKKKKILLLLKKTKQFAKFKCFYSTKHLNKSSKLAKDFNYFLSVLGHISVESDRSSAREDEDDRTGPRLSKYQVSK